MDNLVPEETECPGVGIKRHAGSVGKTAGVENPEAREVCTFELGWTDGRDGRWQGRLASQQIDTGAKMVKAKHGSTSNITKLFADELGPVLRDVTSAVYDLSAALPELVERIKSLAHGDLSSMVAGG